MLNLRREVQRCLAIVIIVVHLVLIDDVVYRSCLIHGLHEGEVRIDSGASISREASTQSTIYPTAFHLMRPWRLRDRMIETERREEPASQNWINRNEKYE